MGNFSLATTKQSYTTQVQSKGHIRITDEPVELGGDDKGPSPYDLLIGALASCTSITLRMYANRKKYDVTEIKVHVNYTKEYREDCESSVDGNKIETFVFNRTIHLTGSLNSEEKQNMLDIANKCPLHKTLEGTIEVNTELKD